MKASEWGLNGVQNGQISICIFFSVVSDALRSQQRPASIILGLLLSSRKKREKKKEKKNERTKQCQTLQERLNK